MTIPACPLARLRIFPLPIHITISMPPPLATILILSSPDRCRCPALASHLRLCLSSDGHHETFDPYAQGKGNAFHDVNLSAGLEKEHGFLKSRNHVCRGSVPSRTTVFLFFALGGWRMD